MKGIVFRYDLETGESRILDDGYRFTNGIAFGPDGLLYVNETITGDVFRYSVGDGGNLGPRELFGNVLDPAYTRPGAARARRHGVLGGRPAVRDGVRPGRRDGARLLGRGGRPARLSTAGAPTNVAFGRRGEQRIYVVEDEKGTIEVHDVGVDGLPLYD